MLLTKKILFGIPLMIFMGLGISFGYFEDNMYCNIINNNIKVSLQKKDGPKCKKYTQAIEQKMKVTYRDVLTIQGYIQKKQDIGYRKSIKDDKVKLINDLQTLRLNILKSMQTFENSLLKKSRELFIAEIQPFKNKLLADMKKIQAELSGSQLNNINAQIQFMDDELKTIQNIENATDFKKLNDGFRRYIYLKKQIEGK